MFKFLKNKIKDAVKKFSKSTVVEVEEVETIVEDTLVIEEEVSKPKPVQKKQSKPTKISKIIDPIDDDVEEVIELHEPKSLLKEKKTDKGKIIEESSQTLSPEIAELLEEDVEGKNINSSAGELFVDEMSSKMKSKIVSIKSKKIIGDIKKDSLDETNLKDELLSEENTTENSSKKLDNDAIKESIEEMIDAPIEISLEKSKSLDVLDTNVISKVEEKKPGFFKRIFGKKDVDKVPLETITESDSFESQEISPDNISLDETPLDSEIISSEEKHILEEKKSPSTDLLNEVTVDATKKKKGFFAKIKEKVVKFQLTDDVFEDLFWDFELALLENNVALEVIEKIKSDLHNQLTQENVSRKGVDQVILDTLKNSLDEVLTVDTFDFLEKVSSKKPFIITMIGVNGSGKTTTLAKLIHLLQKKGLSVVVAASDTFRAAAIQQLEEHTTKLGVKLIKHDYNADPSAVAYDAISHAKAKNLDVVLIDTAGRLQSNSNLMDELKKLIRVNKPDLNIFIGESITGNDCVEQAMAFNDAVGIDGIILSKADIDEKGGAAISVSYITKKPILYVGTGQTYDDLKVFDKIEVLENLGL